MQNSRTTSIVSVKNSNNSEIGSGITRLQESICSLTEAVGELVAKLTPVLSSIEHDSQPVSVEPFKSTSELGKSIDTLQDKVDFIRIQVRSALDKLAL